MGSIYQPKYRDRHGVIQQSQVWWVRFRQHGQTVRQSAETTSETQARAFLRERAIQAADNLKTLQTQIDKYTTRWESPEAKVWRCRVMAETAYVQHLIKEDLVHETVAAPAGGNFEFFHWFLMAEKDEVFDLVSTYLRGEPVASSIDGLPKGWRAAFLANNELDVLAPNFCKFTIKLLQPWTVTVTAP
jgi:hypothetical protein